MNQHQKSSLQDFVQHADPALAQARRDFNSSRFNQLVNLTSSNVEGAWQYLLAVNGGAVAGMLAFIGAVEGYRKDVSSLLALSFFTVGLLLVGAARAERVLKTNHLLEGWIDAMNDYYSGRISWSKVMADDAARTGRLAWLSWTFGWCSLACFVIGVVVSARLFWMQGPGAGA